MFQEQYLTGNFSLRLNWHMHDSEISIGQTCCSYKKKKQFFNTRSNVCFSLYVEKTCVCHVLSETP